MNRNYKFQVFYKDFYEMIQNRRKYFFFSIFFALNVCESPAISAKVLTVEGVFFYGPDVSERDACEAAEKKAKEEALRRVYNESFSVLQQDACAENTGKSKSQDCVYNSLAWSMIDGDIRSVKRIGDPRISKVAGSSKCSIMLEIDVVDASVETPGGLDFDVRVDNLILRSGDNLSFVIQPSGPMYLAIFGWTPLSKKDGNRVIRLFPNDFDRNPLVQNTLKLPTPAGSLQYEFKVEWPKDIKRDFVDEYLIFIATNHPVTWLPEYNFSDFNQRLIGIPRSEKRVSKRSYRVINQN